MNPAAEIELLEQRINRKEQIFSVNESLAPVISLMVSFTFAPQIILAQCSVVELVDSFVHLSLFTHDST